MKVELTALIISQAKTFMVMAAAGILTESLWQIKNYVQARIRRSAKGRGRLLRGLAEAAFWAASAAVISGFLYYCAYGKITLHAAVGFLTGLLLWKKTIHYVILSS